MPAGRCCKNHIESYLHEVTNGKAAIDNEDRVKSEAENVTCYSINFRGKTPHPKLAKKIETEWCPNKQAAAFNLKFIAAWEGCSVILDEQFETTSGDDPENSNHTITWFKCSGVI